MQSAQLWFDLDQSTGISSWPNTPSSAHGADALSSSPRLGLSGSFLHMPSKPRSVSEISRDKSSSKGSPKDRSGSSSQTGGAHGASQSPGHRAHSSDKGAKGKRIFIPDLLAAQPPENWQLMWPPLGPAGVTETEYSRAYVFSIAPLGFLFTIVLSLMRFGWKPKVPPYIIMLTNLNVLLTVTHSLQAFWRDGCVLELGAAEAQNLIVGSSNGLSAESLADSLRSSASSRSARDRLYVRTRPYPGDRRCVEMSVRGPAAAERLGFAANLIETFLGDNNFAELTEVFLPCPHCALAASHAQPFWFTLTEFETALLQMQTSLFCPGCEPPSAPAAAAEGILSGSAAPAMPTAIKRLSMSSSTKLLLQKARILPRSEQPSQVCNDSAPAPAPAPAGSDGSRRRSNSQLDARRQSMQRSQELLSPNRATAYVPSEWVSLLRLAPDLAMDQIPRVPFEDVSATTEIGRGGFAKVCPRTQQGKI